MFSKIYFDYWAERYKTDLVENILPFWLKYGVDKVNGGVYTCLDKTGKLMDTTKSVWFQGRFAFVLSYAYNNIEAKKEYLTIAKQIIDFIEKYCFDSDGRMYFEVSADGTPLRKRRYVFSESFATIAMAEYALASGDKSYAQKALKLFKDMQYFLNTEGCLEPKYLPTLQAQSHSITMIMLNVANCVKKVIEDEALNKQIDSSVFAIKNYFMNYEYKALLEMVGKNGELIDTLNGRTINPGHCIETSWFLLDIARNLNWDKEIVKTSLTILDWSWDWGWDKEFGGIINFKDCKGFPNQDYSQDMKFWWPQTEAIIANLYAFLVSGENTYLQRHKDISDWTYAHFPDNINGEWYGYLHRDGSVAQDAKGNIFKGPFHIPRMMIKSYLLCKEIGDKLK